MRHAIILLAVAAAPLSAVAQRAYEVRNTFRWQHRGAELHEINGRITRVFGRPFGSGQSPQGTAARFCESYAEMFGVSPADLLPGNPHDQRLTQPVMYDADTDTYRYTMVYYRQHCGGIPVYKSEMRLLVANREGHPLVWVNPYLRDVGDYDPAAAGRVLPEQVFQETARAVVPQLRNFTRSRLVVYAGVDHVDAEPRLAVEITGDNLNRPSEEMRKRTFVMDAVTGEVLHSRDGILNAFPDTVSGTVSGLASPDYLAYECTDPLPFVLRPLPYALVKEINGGTSTYADKDGAFVLELGAIPQHTVEAHISGRWFTVTTGQGTLLVATETGVMPDDVIDFKLNDLPAAEYPTAQVNAYIHANEARDRALAANPMFPVIAAQEGFEIRVNDTSNCTLASWGGRFIRFSWNTSSSCKNSAFGDVVHHEYGHHLVASAGSGQKAYGEGMGDVMGILATDVPEFALGWSGDCDVAERSAANNCKYRATGCSTCGGGGSQCGMVLSGSVWDTRKELALTTFGYREVLRDLAVNSMLLHTGSSIDPSIYIDWLVLDDDNADLSDGTPHDTEIEEGFSNHDMTTDVPDTAGGAIYTWTGQGGSNTDFDEPCNWTYQDPCGTDYPQNDGDAAFVDGSTTGDVALVDETIRKLAVSRDVDFLAAAGTPTLQVKAFTLFAPDGDIEVTITTAKIQQPPGP